MVGPEGQGQVEISEPGMPASKETLLPEVGDFRKKFHDKVAGDLDNVDFGGHA